MTLVRAINTGYFGGVVRATGDVFDVPAELWDDPKRRPSWAEAVGGGEISATDEPQAKPVKGRGRKADAAEPFGDAPEPVVAKSNGIKEALGVDPDWVAPKPID